MGRLREGTDPFSMLHLQLRVPPGTHLVEEQFLSGAWQATGVFSRR